MQRRTLGSAAIRRATNLIWTTSLWAALLLADAERWAGGGQPCDQQAHVARDDADGVADDGVARRGGRRGGSVEEEERGRPQRGEDEG